MRSSDCQKKKKKKKENVSLHKQTNTQLNNIPPIRANKKKKKQEY